MEGALLAGQELDALGQPRLLRDVDALTDVDHAVVGGDDEQGPLRERPGQQPHPGVEVLELGDPLRRGEAPGVADVVDVAPI